MRIGSALAIGGSLVVVGAVPGLAQPRQSTDVSAVRASLGRELDHYLNTRRVPEHISAVSLAVTFRGSRSGINLAVGTMRYGGGRAVSPHALWQIGSNTKAFTAVLVLQLEAEHKLSINDTLGRWLPRYRAWRRVTIKRLLNMTSGIPDCLAQPAFQRAYVAAPDQVFSAPWLVSYALGLPPTTGYEYSNTGYFLAQMIIERVTHDSYRDQLRRRIIVPLGLRNTFYTSTVYPRAVLARLPAGYFFQPSFAQFAPQLGKDQNRHSLSWAQGAGGIISSLQDMEKWDRALYGGRELPGKQQRELQSLISEKTGKPIHRTSLADPDGFGLGVSQITTAVLGTVWDYEGGTFGFRVLHIYLPRSGALIALGLNSATDEDHIGLLGTRVYEILHGAGLA